MDSADTPVGSAPKDAHHEAHPHPLNGKRRIEPLPAPVTDSSDEPCFDSPTPPVPSRPASFEPLAAFGAYWERAREDTPVNSCAQDARARSARPLADAALATAPISRKRERDRAPPGGCDESPPWAPLPLPPEMMAVLDMPTPPPAPSHFNSGVTNGEGPAKKRLRRAVERRKSKPD